MLALTKEWRVWLGLTAAESWGRVHEIIGAGVTKIETPPFQLMHKQNRL